MRVVNWTYIKMSIFNDCIMRVENKVSKGRKTPKCLYWLRDPKKWVEYGHIQRHLLASGGTYCHIWQ